MFRFLKRPMSSGWARVALVAAAFIVAPTLLWRAAILDEIAICASRIVASGAANAADATSANGPLRRPQRPPPPRR